MRVERDQTVRLLRAVGFSENVERYSEKKLAATLRRIPGIRRKSPRHEDWREPESAELATLLEDVILTVDHGEGIVVHREEEDVKSRLDEDVDGIDDPDDEPDFDEEPEREPESLGTKSPQTPGRVQTNGHHKPKHDEGEESAPLHGFRLAGGPGKLVVVSASIAETHAKLDPFPRDRAFSKKRKEMLKVAIENGDYTGSTWDEVHVLDNDQTYRVNGKHTSAAFHELFSRGDFDNPHKLTVLVRHWEADTMADAVRLYGTFDHKDSVRTKSNTLQSYVAAAPKLASIKPATIRLAATGMAFAIHERDYKKRTASEQGKLILDNQPFVLWLASMVANKKEYPHIVRMPVVAAMYLTWKKSRDQASEFWTDVRDDCDEKDKTHPKRVLMKYLMNHNFGAPSAKSTKAVVNDREGFVYCLQAWNAWRQGGDYKPAPKYKPDMDTPKVS